jgi:NlpC/P60 family putative phage cell wall peptidase
MTGAGIVALARGWIGTPYVHQASSRGAGADCLGLIRGLWREALGAEPEAVPGYTEDWSEASHDERLWRASEAHLVAREGLAEGAVILFRMRAGAVAKHLGVVSALGPRPAFIHAYSGHCVTESPLSAPWARRIVAVFDFPQRSD